MKAKPCAGEYLPNGDFRTASGRYIYGPLCPKCGALVTDEKCMACGTKTPVKK